MASFSSPMQPVAPPTKKMKAGGSEKQRMDLDSVDAVKKRRDDLNRLRQKQQMRTTEKTTPGGTKVRVPSSQGLLAQARSQLDSNMKPPPLGAPPAPPAVPLDRVRHSDIFPTVDKVAPKAPAPPGSRVPPPPQFLPPPPSGDGREPVVRRLDQSFGMGKSPSAPSYRSKSAPPARPPPPPGRPPAPAAKEAPAATPSRAFSPRPPPMTPATKSAEKAPEIKPPPPLSASKEIPSPLPVPPKMTPPIADPLKTKTATAKPEAQHHPTPPVHVPTTPKAVVGKPAQQSVPLASKTPKAVSENPEPQSAPPSDPVKSSVAAPELELPQQQEQESAPEATAEKPRQTLLRNLHQFAESPAKEKSPALASHESSLLRLEKEVREHEKAKVDALRKVAVLEDQLQKLKEKGDPEEELGSLVRMANEQGAEAALEWARGRVSGTTPKASGPQVGFFSPLSPGLTTPRTKPRKRLPTPHPKRDKKGDGVGPEEKDLMESVKLTPYEYYSDQVTFIIRRPYGIAIERELWFKAGHLNSKQYEKTADVKNASTIEVVAEISFDGSTLALNGDSFVRHIGIEPDADWNEFGSVDDMDKPLGSISYIDKDANEKDYSLDDVLEGAFAARENYCASVLSMAGGLQAKELSGNIKLEPLAVPFEPVAPPPVSKPETVSVGVGTEDLPFAPPAQATHDQPTVGQEPSQMKPPQQAPPLDEDDSPDSVTFLLGAFAAFLVWTVKTVLITLPVRIVSFTILSFISWTILSIVSLQLADDNGAASVGAEFDKMFNQPGIV